MFYPMNQPDYAAGLFYMLFIAIGICVGVVMVAALIGAVAGWAEPRGNIGAGFLIGGSAGLVAVALAVAMVALAWNLSWSTLAVVLCIMVLGVVSPILWVPLYFAFRAWSGNVRQDEL